MGFSFGSLGLSGDGSRLYSARMSTSPTTEQQANGQSGKRRLPGFTIYQWTDQQGPGGKLDDPCAIDGSRTGVAWTGGKSPAAGLRASLTGDDSFTPSIA